MLCLVGQLWEVPHSLSLWSIFRYHQLLQWWVNTTNCVPVFIVQYCTMWDNIWVIKSINSQTQSISVMSGFQIEFQLHVMLWLAWITPWSSLNDIPNGHWYTSVDSYFHWTFGVNRGSYTRHKNVVIFWATSIRTRLTSSIDAWISSKNDEYPLSRFPDVKHWIFSMQAVEYSDEYIVNGKYVSL